MSDSTKDKLTVELTEDDWGRIIGLAELGLSHDYLSHDDHDDYEADAARRAIDSLVIQVYGGCGP